MNPGTQSIRHCQTSDGVRLAYAVSGDGPPLVKAANWLSHLEFDWQSPVLRPLLDAIAEGRTLVRYDERGCGLSSREVEDFSLDTWVRDLETVVDNLGLERFPLLGISQGGAVAIDYAVRHPERVSQLILFGTYARGHLIRDPSSRARDEEKALLEVVKLGWGSKDPAYRQIFTSLFIPGASPEQQDWFNELQRISTPAHNAARFLETFATLDVRAKARSIQAPTLVLHARGDTRVPFDEGRQLAALIPGSRLVPLESNNHILLGGEPAWQVFIDNLHGFLREDPAPSSRINLDTVPADNTAPTQAASPEPLPHHDGGIGHTVLVVDDDPQVRELLDEYLSYRGYRVFQAGDAGTLRQLLDERGVPDVVLMDLRLPGEDGLSLTRFLKSHFPVGVIAISGSDEPRKRILGPEVGADDYIAKPFDLREVDGRIRALMGRQ